MANNGELGNRYACAACKHQRRKCTQDCVFPPYFPGNQSEEFQLVHKIFGVSNLSKIIKNLETPQDRQEAVESIKWEAAMWEQDPVHGPLGAYRKLEREFEALMKMKNQQQTSQQIIDYGRGPVMTTSGLISYPTCQQEQAHVINSNEAPHAFIDQKFNTFGQPSDADHNRSGPTMVGHSYNSPINDNNIVQIMEQQGPRARQRRGIATSSDMAINDGQLPRVGGECYDGVTSYYAPTLPSSSHSQLSGPYAQLPYLHININGFAPRREI